ncbi:hypothetical protein QFC21_003529 [Naganishia friedmannii]|uniref:Uncharacterized protein n=1 Tax=Naganishia friedmannii TaxID=89922 RepID=A0ACC2VN28_9TREE|nr:hypothetical protein QFC21_003529 [Naganishia friedmannii]
MDQLTTPTLKKVVRSVVRKADKRGDIDRGAFTLKVAKGEIATKRYWIEGSEIFKGALLGSSLSGGRLLREREHKQITEQRHCVVNADLASSPPRPMLFIDVPAKALDINTDVLNEKPWKQTVKDLVYEAIENVDTLKNSPVKPLRQDDTNAEQHAFINGFLNDEAKSQERLKKDQSKNNKEVVQARKVKGKKTVVDSDDDAGPEEVKQNRKSAKQDRKSKIVVSEDEQPAVQQQNSMEVDSEAEESLDEHPPPPARKRARSDVESGGSDDDGSVRKSSGKNGQVTVKAKGKRADADGNGKVKPAAKASTSTPAAPSAPVVEDERVKELKSIVVACGLRKQWKKEFEGMNSANEQVAHLKSLLTGLGMTGRPTKAKAKAIKEKRELAAELGDVLEFEAKRGLGITSSRRSNTNTQASPKTARPRETSKKRRTEALAATPKRDDESSGSEELPVPRKKLASPQKKVATTKKMLVDTIETDEDDEIYYLKREDEKM